jgi:hypothetical protein
MEYRLPNSILEMAATRQSSFNSGLVVRGLPRFWWVGRDSNSRPTD